MQDTEILWTMKTWGAVSGCTKVSEGCKFCYAESLAENKRGSKAFPHGFDITERPWKLGEPASIRRPTLIFVNSTSDWFHEGIDDVYRDRMFDAIRAAPRHRYQVLTKRPEAAVRYFETREVPDSVWLGVTVENQIRARERIPLLARIRARVRFLSIEPLLEPIDLAGALSTWAGPRALQGLIHWAIVGGESGNHLVRADVRAERGLADRVNGHWVPMESRIPWVRSLRDQCVAGGVPFFFKQWGGWKGPAAGRLLDGRTWDEMPLVPGAMPDGYVHKAMHE